jgi:hypothetical protein
MRLGLHAAPFAAVSAGWLAYYQIASPSQVKFDDFYWGPHVFENYGVYLSWIAFPAEQIPASPGTLRWMLATVVLAALAVCLVVGPALLRVCAVGVMLALLPFVPVSIWTASRYSYAAVAFAAPIAGIAAYAIYERMRATHRYARFPAMAAGLALVAVIVALYSWQTYAQDARSGRYTERWETLATELERNYADVPDGTTIYIVDGLWQNPMEQYTWVPSVARALYGDAAAFDLPRSAYATEPRRPNAIYLRWESGRLVPVPEEWVTAAH